MVKVMALVLLMVMVVLQLWSCVGRDMVILQICCGQDLGLCQGNFTEMVMVIFCSGQST